MVFPSVHISDINPGGCFDLDSYTAPAADKASYESTQNVLGRMIINITNRLGEAVDEALYDYTAENVNKLTDEQNAALDA